MKQSFYIYNGGTLSRHDNSLQFITADGNKRDIPVEKVSDIYVMSEMSLNTSLLNFLSKHGIIVHFFNYYDFYSGSFYPREQMLAGQLLIKQTQYYIDNDKRLFLAQKFIDAASYNIYRNLRYYNARERDLSKQMSEIDCLRKCIYNTSDVNELMGIEGNIRKVYYSCWSIIINQKMDFQKRVKNPPDNEVNSLISYVNTLIYTKTLSEVYKTQLNPTISYLHQPGVRRFSLCLDVSEIFKPLLADRLIFSLLNKNQITKKSFTPGLDYLHLTQKASQTIVTELENKMLTTIKHKGIGRNVSYKYLIRLELYKLIKHLIGEKEYDGFKIWW